MTVADIIASITKGPLPFKVEAYDGSSIGSGDITVRLENEDALAHICLLYTSPSPRDVEESRMPSSA